MLPKSEHTKYNNIILTKYLDIIILLECNTKSIMVPFWMIINEALRLLWITEVQFDLIIWRLFHVLPLPADLILPQIGHTIQWVEVSTGFPIVALLTERESADFKRILCSTWCGVGGTWPLIQYTWWGTWSMTRSGWRRTNCPQWFIRIYRNQLKDQ